MSIIHRSIGVNIVNLSFSFVSCVSKHLIEYIAI